MSLNPINLAEKFSIFDDHWSPKIVAELNGQHVKLGKLLGEFEWHQHDNEDELFWVVKGTLDVHFRDRVVTLSPGELLVIPRGVEHKPVAADEVHLVMFEPASTINTGANESERTVATPEWI